MYIKNVQKGEHYMKQVTVRLDEEMHKAGKIRAIIQNKSFMQYVVDLIKKDLDNKKEQSR